METRIANRLRAASKGTPDYWDFRDCAEDLASKCLFQYPAMMVPAMQKQVIAAILNVRPEVETIADPFLGSGTILALAMLSGRAFIGQDINPLAILIAKTRAFSLDQTYLAAAVQRVNTFANSDNSICYDIRFFRQTKWFTRGANIGLSRLRRAIRVENDLNARRFLWVCMAETVRLNSNSRTSTYKLHVKPEADRTANAEDVLNSFAGIAENNLKVVADFRASLLKAGLLNEAGQYNQRIQILYGDTTKKFPSHNGVPAGQYQVIITSPPYGDNKTTVPYGQAAWLPLQWIDLKDIDDAIPKDAVTGYYDVDNRSLGGTRPRNFSLRQETLAQAGDHTMRYIKLLPLQECSGSFSLGGIKV
ncbi:MAG: DNA methyltransferase [Formivibrio sp.]|nr:DNA methyltransferase [Formivibrio sp.]